MRIAQVVALSLLILFDPSPSADVTSYRCHAFTRAPGKMGEPMLTVCTITGTWLGAPSLWQMYTYDAIPLGAVTYGCVEAVDYSGNVSDCVGGKE